MISIVTCVLALPIVAQERRAVPVPESQAVQRAPANLRLALYDVAGLTGLPDLEAAVREAERRAPALAAADAQLDFERLERRRTQFESQRNGLLAALREGMQPPAGDDTRVEWLPGGRLAVLAEPAQQTWVQTFLARPQAFDGMFDVSIVLWSLPIGPEATALVRRNRELLLAPELEELLRRLEALGAERTTAPRVLCFAFAPIELSAGNELPYVADWEFLELTDREGSVPAPIVQTAFEGFRMHSTCFPTLDGRVSVEVDLAHTVLTRPIASLETTFGGSSAPVVVQLPEWTSVQIDGRVDLAQNETLLLAAEDTTARRVVLALVRARSVEAFEER